MGRASACLLAERGAKVVVADRNGEGARTVCDGIVGKGGTAVSEAVDVGDSGDVAGLVERTLQNFGRIDVLLHAAGICPRKPILEMTDQEWREVLRINLDG